MGQRDDHIPLYPTEDRIAREILGAERAKDWPSVAAHDERRGLPRIDTVHGGRYWPAVLRFYETLNGLDRQQDGAGTSRSRVRILDTAQDGKENFSAEKDASLRHRGPDRRAIRSRP